MAALHPALDLENFINTLENLAELSADDALKLLIRANQVRTHAHARTVGTC